VRLTARVPATSANLGPGFDCFGLALDLCNEVTIDTEAEPGVSWEGEGVIRAGAAVVCILTGHGLTDPEWAIAGAAHPAGVPGDAAVVAAELGL
jgi:hypothetical protein